MGYLPYWKWICWYSWS